MITITCEMCGARFNSVSKSRRFCEDCYRKRESELARRRYMRSKGKTSVRPMNGPHTKTVRAETEWKTLTDKFEKKADGPSLTEVARAAAKAGMSYGKYVEKYGDKLK